MQAYYHDESITLFHGDCREILPSCPTGDVVIADPPYGETSLVWDRRVDGWLDVITEPSLWCFGSMRLFMEERDLFKDWKFAQDIIWQKHNGSGFHADRFRRIHEHVVQFYRGKWANLYKSPVYTNDATKRTVRAKGRPTHMGQIDRTPYISEDGGPRLQRSIIEVRSCHGYAEHPTQKPVDIIKPLIEYSCPLGGMVVVPFAGSGSDLVAARELGRRALGVELDERNCEIAANRLRKAA